MSREYQKTTEINWPTAIASISETLTGKEKEEIKLKSVLDYIVTRLGMADTGIIWVQDLTTSRLMAHTTSGLDPEDPEDMQIQIGEGLIGRVFRTGKYELYEANEANPGAEANIEKITGVNIKDWNSKSAIICLPLSSGGERLGVLTLFAKQQKSQFAENNVLFLKATANMIAMAIENATDRKDSRIKEAIMDNGRNVIEVISTVAHEMRTPLTSIKGYSSALLMEGVTFRPEVQREFLEIIDRECDLLEGLISDFLESSTVEAGTLKIELQPVRLPILALEAVEEIRQQYPEYTILTDFGQDFPLVDADPERILQVLRQLLDNAVKYSPGGGMIVVHGKVKEDQVVISVADEGAGIAPEDLNHLFERFFRAKTRSGTKTIGTGLGLPISRAIVEAHNGNIWAESQLGQGSVFSFSLPLNRTDRDQAD